MYYLMNNCTNPYLNIALEEYLFSNAIFNEDIIIIWRNSNSIFMGKNQNPYQEVCHGLLESKEIPLIRRISGGGCVYHDLGNINISFIQKNKKLDEINFIQHTKFMQEMLNSLGLNVSISDRKDILLNGKKISGSAQCIKGKNTLYHGTLLYESDLKNLNEFLLTKKTVESNATKSVRSKVTNIAEHLDMSIDSFLMYCVDYIKKRTEAKEILLDDNHLNEIKELAYTKYKDYNWNFGKTPKFKLNIVEEEIKIIGEIKKWKFNELTVENKGKAINLDKLIGTDFSKSKVESILNSYNIDCREIINAIF